MADLLYLVALGAFFAVTVALVRLVQRLQEI